MRLRPQAYCPAARACTAGPTRVELDRYFAGVHALYATLPADRYPALTAIAEDMTGLDSDERFAFGLDLILDGLEATSAAEKAAERQPG